MQHSQEILGKNLCILHFLMINTMLVLAFCIFLFGEIAILRNKLGLRGGTPREVVGRKYLRCGRRIVRYEILKYECCHTFMCGQLIQKRVQEKSQIVKLVARRLRKVSFNNMLFIDLYPEGMKVHIFKLRTF